MSKNTTEKSRYSEVLAEILVFANKASAIYVPVQGTGGASVQVNRKDFIQMMEALENFDGHGTFQNNILYMGG